MFWAMFVAAGFVVVSLRASALAYPKEQTALVAGIAAGSWSALVAIILPMLGGMFDAGRYDVAFYIVSSAPDPGRRALVAADAAGPTEGGARMKIDGACHCGRISYEAEIDPADVTICHCTDCQTLSGSAFRTVVPARSEASSSAASRRST